MEQKSKCGLEFKFQFPHFNSQYCKEYKVENENSCALHQTANVPLFREAFNKRLEKSAIFQDVDFIIGSSSDQDNWVPSLRICNFLARIDEELDQPLSGTKLHKGQELIFKMTDVSIIEYKKTNVLDSFWNSIYQEYIKTNNCILLYVSVKEVIKDSVYNKIFIVDKISDKAFEGSIRVSFKNLSDPFHFSKYYGGSIKNARSMKLPDNDKFGIFSWVEFDNVDFSNSHFEKCSFNNTIFRNCILENVQFVDCKISNANFSGCMMDRAQLLQCKIIDTNFGKGSFANSLIQNGTIKDTCFNGLSFDNTTIKNVDIIRTRFKSVDIEKINSSFSVLDEKSIPCKLIFFIKKKGIRTNRFISNDGLIIDLYEYKSWLLFAKKISNKKLERIFGTIVSKYNVLLSTNNTLFRIFRYLGNWIVGFGNYWPHRYAVLLLFSLLTFILVYHCLGLSLWNGIITSGTSLFTLGLANPKATEIASNCPTIVDTIKILSITEGAVGIFLMAMFVNSLGSNK